MSHSEEPAGSALESRLFRPGPKHILSLDGGGVRGIVSLGFLERAESLLRDFHKDADFRLCDHFDLVGGTSTGAVIAAGLALGFNVADLIDIYLNLTARAFRGGRWHRGILGPKFPEGNLERAIKEVIGDTRLGSANIRTGLAIVAKRIDTTSPWIFHNNPRSRFYDTPPDDPSAIANRDLPLATILRASTAAPTYFKPERIEVSKGLEGLFVDGGVSPFNNPSLLLLMMSTSNAYGYGWGTGNENLSLLSVGTAVHTPVHQIPDYLRLPSGLQALLALESVVKDNMWFTQAVLQWLCLCRSPWQIDSEAGHLALETPVSPPLAQYERYEVLLDPAWLTDELSIDLAPQEIKLLKCMDRPESVNDLLDIARKAAARQVSLQSLGV